LRPGFRSVPAGRLLRVEAAVGDAAGEGKARLARLDGKFRRDENVPQGKRPVEVGVGAVGAVIGQRELLARELPDHQHARKAFAQCRRGVRLRHRLLDALRALHEIEMALHRLPVIRGRRATLQGECHA
jgi:hypothetical protein